MARASGKRLEFIENYRPVVFGDDHHAKRVASLGNGTFGVMTSASLAVSIIGQSLAQARGRRTKLPLLNVFAIALLTILGTAREALGIDRHLRVNTARHRTHSLFRRGRKLYELTPNMPTVRL